MSKGPSRMRDPIRLDAAVAVARAAVGTPARVSKLHARVASAVGASSGGFTSADANAHADASAGGETSKLDPSIGSSGVSSAARAVTLKASAVVASLAALGGAAWVATHLSLAAEQRTMPRPASTPSQQTRERSRSESSVAVVAPRDTPDVITPSAAAQPRRDISNLVSPPPSAATRPSQPAIEDAAVRGASGPRGAASNSRARTPLSHPIPATSPRRTTGESEVQLITRAQALIDSQPSAAMDALREHERSYPQGMLREERDVLRIDAEWALDQPAAALAHARAFVQSYPHSTQKRRFMQLLSDHKTEADATRTK